MKQVPLFTAYTWMGGSGGDGYSFRFVSDSIKHDKYSVITCLEILADEITSIVSDVQEIVFFSGEPALQFKNLCYTTFDNYDGQNQHQHESELF